MRFLLILTILLTLSLVPASRQVELRKGKDYALFFAVDSYHDTGWKGLRNPIKDSKSIAKELREIYNFDTQIIPNPDRATIFNTLLAWQKKRFASDGQLFIFFSGHGTFSDAFTQGYFIPRDGKAHDPIHDSHIELTKLGNLITNIPCPHILLAIDACYSGTIDQQIAFKGKPAFNRPRSQENEDDRLPIVELQLRNKTRLLLTSGGKERTPDGVDHSPFSGAILKTLRQAYTSGDGMVLFKDITATMERVRPVPHSGVLPGHEEGGFVFLGPRAITHTPSNPVTRKIPRVITNTDLPIPLPKMILVDGGSFMMGSEEGDDDEKPVHKVTLSPFYMAETEVTVAQFKVFIEDTGYKTDADKDGGSYIYFIEDTGYKTDEDKDELSYFRNGIIWEKKLGVNWRCDVEGDKRSISNFNHPVIHISWNDAVAYTQWVFQKTGDKYRLPTEAEWEYAAGGGASNRTKYAGTNSCSTIDAYAVHRGNSNRQTAAVKSKRPNTLGLYDMSGNVYEWCQDWNGTYPSSFQINPTGPTSGSGHILRGGSEGNDPQYCRVANRGYNRPSYRSNGLGFRLSRTP